MHRLRPGDRGRGRAALRRVSFTQAVGEPITRFGSVEAVVRPLSRGGAHVAVIHLAPGGVVGRHPAVGTQLFLVFAGWGWVSGSGGEREPIAAGEAVVWEAGEEHESGSDEAMTAIVVEAEEFDV